MLQQVYSSQYPGYDAWGLDKIGSKYCLSSVFALFVVFLSQLLKKKHDTARVTERDELTMEAKLFLHFPRKSPALACVEAIRSRSFMTG